MVGWLEKNKENKNDTKFLSPDNCMMIVSSGEISKESIDYKERENIWRERWTSRGKNHLCDRKMGQAIRSKIRHGIKYYR